MLCDCKSLDNYLEQYGNLLADQTERAFLPLHVPAVSPPIAVDTVRPLFEAQAHSVTGIVKGWHQRKSMVLCSEMGTGKTIMGIAAIHAHAGGKPYRAMVFAPDHLVNKWAQREIPETLGNVYVEIIDDWKQLTKMRRGTKPKRVEWYVIGRNKAKLGPFWKPAYRTRPKDQTIYCPDCGQAIMDDKKPMGPADLERKRLRCQAANDAGVVCNGALWKYIRQPDRWAPATYIHKKLKHFFRYLIIDEVHEEKSDTSAQGLAAGSLAAAVQKVLALTGTLIGGYAEHIRPLLFRLAPGSLVKEGFRWKDALEFVRQYGCVDTIITSRSGGKGGFGGDGDDNRMSRGNSRSKREAARPGVMPTLYARHLLGATVFLSLDEVACGLPTLTEQTMAVKMDDELADCYEEVETALREKIKEMLRRGNKQLLGTMLQTLLCYPDYPYDWGPVGYTDHKNGGDFCSVVQPQNLTPGKVRQKERQLLDLIHSERMMGRQVWVFVQFTDKRPVSERLALLLQAEGLRARVLPSTVDPRKREAWIEKHAPTCDVIISHPQVVATGLDLFCKKGRYNFPTLVFYETGYNLFTLRQASRRSWRISQRHPCKVVYFYYSGTMQDKAMGLMGKKMNASLALEGKFSEEGLAAMGEGQSIEMELAKSLVDHIPFDAGREWGKISMASGPAMADEMECDPFSLDFDDLGFDASYDLDGTIVAEETDPFDLGL